MSNPRDPAHLADIAKAAERILEFLEGLDLDSFRLDARTNFAVQHQFIVMGEASKRLSMSERYILDTIPWTKITGMRDRIVHGYDTVDDKIVWDTARNDLPVILEIVQKRLASFRPRD